MPTGYTADITAQTTLEEFTLRCARAFGALVEMRDDPMDSPIPEFKPSAYRVKALEDAQAALAAAKELTTAQAVEQIAAANDEAAASRARCTAERDAQRSAYRRMVALVEAWKPPTTDHEVLKTFMLKQLNDSSAWDCPDDGGRFAQECYPSFDGTPAEWIAKQVQAAVHSVEYHTKELQEESERATSRNDWVRQLRESLKA